MVKTDSRPFASFCKIHTTWELFWVSSSYQVLWTAWHPIVFTSNVPQGYCTSPCFHSHAIRWSKSVSFSSVMFSSEIAETGGPGLTGYQDSSSWRTAKAPRSFRERHLLKDSMMQGTLDMGRGKASFSSASRSIVFPFSWRAGHYLFFVRKYIGFFTHTQMCWPLLSIWRCALDMKMGNPGSLSELWERRCGTTKDGPACL